MPHQRVSQPHNKPHQTRDIFQHTALSSRDYTSDTQNPTLRNSHFHHDLSLLPIRTTPPLPLQAKQSNPATEADTAAPLPTPSGGRSIPGTLRAKMERTFGTNFSDVKIHEGHQAPAIGAIAYTQVNRIHFAPGKFNPSTPAGQALLGHELAHVVQQRQGRVKPTTQVKGLPVNDNPALEREADQLGQKAAQA